MAKTFKEYITESFSKSFSYRIKLAGDFGSADATSLENILGKYGVQSVSSFKRTPIQEEPLDFKCLPNASRSLNTPVLSTIKALLIP